MSFFSSFFEGMFGGQEGKVKRHIKRVANLNIQTEERQMSAQWLAEEGTPEAIYGMMARFTLNYEHRMKDADEKRYVVGLLMDLGIKSCGPIKKWMRKNDAFALPLSVIEQIEGEDAVIDVLLDMLGREVDPFKPEKKRQILIKLAEHYDDRIIERVPACLEDFDEGIRYAAAEVLLAQDTDVVRPELAAAMANREEESNRLRVRIAEAFQRRNWTLGEHEEALAERPPVGWRVVGGRIMPSS